MARNSKREQILEYHVKYLIGKVQSIKTVVRVMPTYEGLQAFSQLQFPVAAVVGGVPIPVEKKSSRSSHGVDLITSLLKIDNYIYIQENEDQDSVLSNIMDDVWVKCYSSTDYGGLVISTELLPEQETAVWSPFIAFKITSQVKYIHTTGGI